jgi:hypothetical protein
MHHQKRIQDQILLLKQDPAKTGPVTLKMPGTILLNILSPTRPIKRLKNPFFPPNIPPITIPMVMIFLLTQILPGL